MYGVEPLNQSQSRPGLQWARIGDLHANMAGQTINLRARVHTTRGTGECLYELNAEPLIFAVTLGRRGVLMIMINVFFTNRQAVFPGPPPALRHAPGRVRPGRHSLQTHGQVLPNVCPCLQLLYLGVQDYLVANSCLSVVGEVNDPAERRHM